MDSFNGLSWGGEDAGTKKRLERMSLAERQQYLSQNPNGSRRSSIPGSSSNVSAWTGLDLLSSSQGTNTAVAASTSSSGSLLMESFGTNTARTHTDSKTTTPSLLDVDSEAEPIGNGQRPSVGASAHTGSLLDFSEAGTDFVGTTTVKTDVLGGDSSNNTNNGIPLDQPDEEDPFDVFNRPVESVEVPSKQELLKRKPQPEPQSYSHHSHSHSRLQSPSHSPDSFDSAADSSRSTSAAGSQTTDPSLDPAADHAIAELIDMGFSVEQSREALRHTKSGNDVRQAIDYIMTEAHRKATGQPSLSSSRASPSRGASGRASRTESRTESRSESRSESVMHNDLSAQELSKVAQELSSQLFTKASSFWSQGRKNLAKAIDQYNRASHGSKDGNMPAWMDEQNRETLRTEFGDTITKARHEIMDEVENLTQDAEMLELERPRPTSRNSSNVKETRRHAHDDLGASQSDPVLSSEDRRERLSRIPRAGSNEPARLRYASKQDMGPGSQQYNKEGTKKTSSSNYEPSLSQRFKDSAVAEEMPARRRSPKQTGALNDSKTSASPSASVGSSAGSSARATRAAAPKVSRPSVPMSSAAQDMSGLARTSGNEAFKRGDFPKALDFYSQALQSIPPKHLLRTVLLSNRAACHLKVGDTQAALQDVDEGLSIIGPSFGVGEDAEPGKPLKDIWGKLIQKRAEAYEHSEKFGQSLESWDLLLHNGFSNPVTLAGKRRCQQALQPKPAPKPKPKPSSKAPLSSEGPTSASGKAAVERVKKANASAVQVEAERFNLTDSVDLKLSNWKNGKEDNLRTLLASLDAILWPDLQWKKVGMAELVLPKKVKLIYMKAVAKTHPDKLPVNATTEQKMISESVFVTLNKAWDTFKAENNLL